LIICIFAFTDAKISFLFCPDEKIDRVAARTSSKVVFRRAIQFKKCSNITDVYIGLEDTIPYSTEYKLSRI
jgi:hypothetical protein